MTQGVPGEDEMTDLDELRKLAEAATPGPWVAEEWGPDATVLRSDGSRIICGDALYHPEFVADAAYIAAANPATILRLLDLIQENSDDQ